MKLKEKFSVKDMGEVHQLLGMVIERDRGKRNMLIHQGPYIRRMLNLFDIEGIRPYRSPAPEDLYV